jgi:hypothetical protein
MEGLDLKSPAVLGSVICAAILFAVVSSLLQMYSAEKDPEAPMNMKAILRDGILGGIGVGMGWALLPETMKSIIDSVSGAATSAAASVAPSLTGGASSSSGPELQTGPARF